MSSQPISQSDLVDTFFGPVTPIVQDETPERVRPLAADPNGRIDSFDAARLIAVLGIIYIHAAESAQLATFGWIGTFGVPFYLFASLYFQARSFRRHPERQLQDYVLLRVRRLYLPFVAWMLIYLLARNFKHIAISHQPLVPLRYWHFWTGTANHLWFLPMLVGVTILSGALCRAFIYRRTTRWATIVVCAILGVLFAIAPRPSWFNHVSDDQGYFLYQCWKVLPSVFLGIALAWPLAWQSVGRVVLNPLLGVMGATLTLVMITSQITYGYSRIDRTLSGLGWFIAALVAWRGPWVKWAARLGRHGYGIYLSHILFVEGFQAVGHKLGYGISVQFDLLCILAAIIGSTIVAIQLDRNRRLRWLNGE